MTARHSTHAEALGLLAEAIGRVSRYDKMLREAEAQIDTLRAQLAQAASRITALEADNRHLGAQLVRAQMQAHEHARGGW